MQNIFSKFLSLNTRDLIKGLLMAVLGAVLGVITTSFEAGTFTLDWTNIWHLAAATAVSYLVKNLFTNSKDQLLKGE